MFKSPHPVSHSEDTGFVIQVDTDSKFCKVKTTRGLILHSVRWLSTFGISDRGGDRSDPSIGDEVYVSYGSGSPVILGCLSRFQSQASAFPINILGTSDAPTSAALGLSRTVKQDQNRPSDMVEGDRVISSKGGGVFAILRSGAVLIRASRASELFLSRLTGLVRLVSREWNHFTDASTRVIRNVKGRTYEYYGISPSFTDAKEETYQYERILGDVVAGLALKASPAPYLDVLTSNDRLFRERVLQEGQEIATQTLFLNGDRTFLLSSADIQVKLELKATGVVVSWANTGDSPIDSSVTLTSEKAEVQRQGSKLSMTDSELTAEFKDGAKMSLNATEGKMTKGGHSISVADSGVTIS